MADRANPVGYPPPGPVQAPRTHGVGLVIPPRESDCSGQHPAWWSWVHNVCDDD